MHTPDARTPGTSLPPTPAGGANRTPTRPTSRPQAASAAPPVPPTSLDTTEITSQRITHTQAGVINCPCDASQEFRHSHWHRQRQATWEALRSTSQSDTRVEAFEGCGSGAWVERSTVGPEDYRVKASHCRDRFCSPCALARSYAIVAPLMAMANGKTLRFVTLTLRGGAEEDLRARLDRLYDSFRQLRRLAIWMDNVDGGVAVCEVKRAETGRWHVHLHILVEGKYLDQPRLSKAWFAITGDSWIVHVRAVRDTAKATGYVAKYAGKPMEAGFWVKRNLLEECILALRGRRLVTCFGTWYNAAKDLDDDALFEEDDGNGQGWVQVGTLVDVWRLAQEGDAQAANILAMLRVRDPITGERPPRSTDPPR